MALYLITYDLRKVRDYTELYQALGELRAIRLLQSVWLAELVGPAETLLEILKAYVDGDDGLAVVELEATAEWAVRGVEPSGALWLQAHIPMHDRAA